MPNVSWPEPPRAEPRTQERKRSGLVLLRRSAAVAASALGILFLAQTAIGLLGLPQGLKDWLSGRSMLAASPPACIVVLGGGGIPSESGLIRAYYAAECALKWPDARVVVALPCDGTPETSSVGRMRDELVMRGVAAGRIALETRGRNTHEQAERVRDMLGTKALSQALVVVTSPTHVRRSLLCFRKEGFVKASGLAAENTGAEADIGRGTMLRYGFWSNLQQEADVARELTALAVYKLRGWI